MNPQKNKVQGQYPEKTQNKGPVISLEPTINFDKIEKGGTAVQNGPRSWVDDWKWNDSLMQNLKNYQKNHNLLLINKVLVNISSLLLF